MHVCMCVCMYRGWENNGNTKIIVYISFLIRCWTNFCLKYNRSPWNGPFTSFEQSLAEFYTILLEEHLQVALEMLEA
jgi:hypothetical protein